MSSLESSWVSLNEATFGLSVLFALVAFVQLIITASYGFSKSLYRGFPVGQDSEREAGPESEGHSQHRRTLSILMVLSLLFITVSFTFKATSYVSGFNDAIPLWADLSLYTKEIATELLLAGLHAFLAYRSVAVEQWRTNSRGSEPGAYGAQKSGRSSMVFSVVVVLVMFSATVCRIVLTAVNAGTVTTIRALVFFIAFQLYMLGLIILTIHFVVLAVSAWKRRDISFFEPLDLSSGNITFDPNFVSATREPATCFDSMITVQTLRSMVYYVSPALCILTAFEIIWDILSVLYSGRFNWELILASTVVEGIILLFIVAVTVKAGIMPRNTSYLSDFTFSNLAYATALPM